MSKRDTDQIVLDMVKANRVNKWERFNHMLEDTKDGFNRKKVPVMLYQVGGMPKDSRNDPDNLIQIAEKRRKLVEGTESIENYLYYLYGSRSQKTHPCTGIGPLCCITKAKTAKLRSMGLKSLYS